MTVSLPGWTRREDDESSEEVYALVIAWCADDPRRVGELMQFPDGSDVVFGSGVGTFLRQRPQVNEETAPVAGRALSAEQLRVRASPEGLEVARVGQCPLMLDGRTQDRGRLRPGDTLLLQGELLLLCTRRPRRLPGLRDFPADALGSFGAPDADGFVGESPAAHRLRDQVAFHGKASTNVLLLGPSGSGKELAARAIHRLSRRANGPWVARNAATFPAGLIDAELFGNLRNYPNPGMAERPGLIGQAHSGTLFLDEIGELPADLQAHLLRVLDGDGEYHRLGEATPRHANLRLLAATNRPAQSLKHDLLARLTLRLTMPGLEARREDIPLLARHLLHQAAANNPEIATRFVADKGPWAGEPRIDPALVDHLIRHHYSVHLRELDTLLWQAMAGSRHYYVALTEEVFAHWTPAPRTQPEPAPVADEPPAAAEPTLEDIRAAIAAADGNLARAARALNLSRYALYRVLKKHGIDAADVRDPD